MIVIDASALSKYVLKESLWRSVRDFILANKPLVSVDLLIKEVLNVIWGYAVTLKVIDRSAAEELVDGVMGLIKTGVILLENSDQYLSEAVKIAFENSISVFDSLYIAQALKHGGLLTSDEKQAEVARKLNVKVHYI
ncbi:MAG: hypothetical protein B7O98_08255 [Zestosphaera tikiterensis]|uniref:PIN domain-containing protein n=1 Tax=Zestosphaera tikiterensis TaxID=1973259 RepID=A0A2R7Y4M2_9CREN|nr:MAG: hypothetical protein B7O98_08255 [Zestosphaera tikiterensis]